MSETRRNDELNGLEEELIDALKLNPPQVKILCYLLEYEKATSKTLGRDLEMQQPVVSVACKKLLKANVITKRQDNTRTGPGRKIFIYELAASPVAVMNAFLVPSIDRIRSEQHIVKDALLLAKSFISKKP